MYQKELLFSSSQLYLEISSFKHSCSWDEKAFPRNISGLENLSMSILRRRKTLLRKVPQPDTTDQGRETCEWQSHYLGGQLPKGKKCRLHIKVQARHGH